MTDSEWLEKEATFSHNNAAKEFRLTKDEIFQAMKSGKLQYRENYAHGNPYFRLLRSEVKSLAEELHGIEGLKKQEIQYELNEINKQINSLKRKLKTLEMKKIELVERQEL